MTLAKRVARLKERYAGQPRRRCPSCYERPDWGVLYAEEGPGQQSDNISPCVCGWTPHLIVIEYHDGRTPQ